MKILFIVIIIILVLALVFYMFKNNKGWTKDRVSKIKDLLNGLLEKELKTIVNDYKVKISSKDWDKVVDEVILRFDDTLDCVIDKLKKHYSYDYVKDNIDKKALQLIIFNILSSCLDNLHTVELLISLYTVLCPSIGEYLKKQQITSIDELKDAIEAPEFEISAEKCK